MSIHRYAARRDSNEPEIRKRFAHHGWHTEQVSGAGMPDLMCWPESMVVRSERVHRGGCLSLSVLVDVKDGDGKPTKAQVSKWTYLRIQGIPIYVVRTEADVDALVAGTLEPWTACKWGHPGCDVVHPMGPDDLEEDTRRQAARVTGKRTPKASYTPPRSTPVDAAKEAEAFAPPAPCHVPGCVGVYPCPFHQLPNMGKR